MENKLGTIQKDVGKNSGKFRKENQKKKIGKKN